MPGTPAKITRSSVKKGNFFRRTRIVTGTKVRESLTTFQKERARGIDRAGQQIQFSGYDLSRLRKLDQSIVKNAIAAKSERDAMKVSEAVGEFNSIMNGHAGPRIRQSPAGQLALEAAKYPDIHAALKSKKYVLVDKKGRIKLTSVPRIIVGYTRFSTSDILWLATKLKQ